MVDMVDVDEGAGVSLSAAAAAAAARAPDDWLQQPSLLPQRPLTFIESKYRRLFAVDVQGVVGHDQYVYFAPNGVAVVGVAPGSTLIQRHRQATGYQPLPLKLSAQDAYIASHGPLEDEEAAAEIAGGDEAADDGPAAAADGDGGCGAAAAAGAGHAGDAPGLRSEAAAAAATGPSTAGAEQAHDDASGTKPVEVVAEPAAATCFPVERLQCVNFNVGKTNRADIKTSGRKQHGTFLGHDGLLCRVESMDGDSLPLLSCLPGKLLEVNQRLLQEPRLLLDRPCCEGYVAIMFPNAGQARQAQQRLMPVEQYMRLRGLTLEELL